MGDVIRIEEARNKRANPDVYDIIALIKEYSDALETEAQSTPETADRLEREIFERVVKLPRDDASKLIELLDLFILLAFRRRIEKSVV